MRLYAICGFLVSLPIGAWAIGRSVPPARAAPQAGPRVEARDIQRGGPGGASPARSSPAASLRAARQRAAGPPAATSFDARVISVRRGAFPNAQLVLDLSQVGRPSAVRNRGDRRRLTVQARAPRASGRAAGFTDSKSIDLAGAYYLIPGDFVQGRIRYAGGGWVLDALQRVAPPPPPRVASLRVELSTDRETYPLGDDVRLNLKVTNQGTAPVVFTFTTAQRYDFVVRQGSQEIWRWSAHHTFPPNASSLTLGPGEVLGFREVWSGEDNSGTPVLPGDYTVIGWMTSTVGITESSAEIEIQEPEPSGPTVGDLISSPRLYTNQEITLDGIYRAHIAEQGEPLVEGGPPTSRGDWVLEDSTGGIYVAGSGAVVLNPDTDFNHRVRVHGMVRMDPEGRLYIRAWEVERIGSRGR